MTRGELYRMETEELIEAIQEADTWYEDTIDMLKELAERVGIEPDEYTELDKLAEAVQKAVGTDIGA